MIENDKWSMILLILFCLIVLDYLDWIILCLNELMFVFCNLKILKCIKSLIELL